MNAHERYEELASLAPLGELSQNEHAELLTHLSSCSDCRKTYAASGAVAEAAFVVGSSMPEDEMVEDQRYRRARQTIAQRLAPMSRSVSIFQANWEKVLVAATVGVALFVVGFYIGGRVLRSQSQATATLVVKLPPATAPISIAPVQSSAVASDDRISELEHELEVAKNEKQVLRDKLESADQSRITLESRLQVLVEESVKQKSEKEQTSVQLEASQDKLALAQKAMQSAQMNVNALEAQMANHEEQISDLKNSLDREREMLSAGREVRDVMGARELHIVDVVDRDSKGRVRKAFGRAFYTQGKSLIFYAFDLPSKSTADGKFVYAAWGSNSNQLNNPATHGLGIFYNDDQKQHRWAMKFSDPKTLEEIDTVFVTLEPADSPLTAPTGKRILEAYFGTPPNHP